MANAWTSNGPVSTPPRPLAYFAGLLLVILAVAGVALGLRAAWRQAGAPSLSGGTAEASSDDDTLTAKPIVDLPAPVAAPEPAKDAANDTNDADEAKADAIAAKTAAAQAIQSKPAKTGGDIDDILASTSEKPPAAAKPAADEAPPPGPPVKSDVPF